MGIINGVTDGLGSWRLWKRLMVLLCLLFVPPITSSAVEVTLGWTPSPTPTVTGYKVYWGLASGVYDSSLLVGNVTNATVPGLISGQTYYFTVTARNAEGAESVPCQEVSETPTPPVITWPAPQAIVYGTTLGPAELSATANLPGTFAYAPPAGTTLGAGPGQSLTATFTPDDPKYSPCVKTVLIDVLQATLTVRADNKSRPYGASNPGLTASFSGFVNGETLATSGVTGTPGLTTSAQTSSPVGTYPISITPGSLAAANYGFTLVNGTLTISRATLTVRADDKRRPFGASNPALTASFSGFVNGETLATSGVTGTPGLATSALTSSPVGTYPISITPGSLVAANYGFSLANGTLTVSGSVLGRHIVYNNSAWDGKNPAATPEDDNALASDKTALLPGGQARFANYTGYSRGINAIMVDLAGSGGAPALTDFSFRVGNTDTPDSWAVAPLPSSITARPLPGEVAGRRVTLIWADNTIRKQWLQVTVRATPNTLLETDDVFYFGNTAGECGNSTTDALVTSLDLTLTRNAIGASNVPVTSTFDHNRDGRVTSLDQSVCRNNISAIGLRLITVPAASSMPGMLAAPSPQAAPAQATAVTQLPLGSAAKPERREASLSAPPTAPDATLAANPRIAGLFLQQNEGLRIEFVGQPGAVFRLETTEALGLPWTPSPARPRLLNAQGLHEVDLPDVTGAGARFYRVIQE